MIAKIFWTAALFMIGIVGASAQSDVPSQIDAALADLSERVGASVALTDLDAFEWRAERYNDSSLGCPQPGQSYLQVITEGFQFVLGYQGNTYDYRVSSRNSAVLLCSVVDGAQITPPAVTPTVQPAVITADSLNGLIDVIQLGDDSAGVVAWAPSGDFVATASSDEPGIWLYRITDDELQPLQRERLPLDEVVTALAFNADASLLAIGDEQGMLHVITPASPTAVRSISLFDEPVAGLAFSPDSRRLMASSATSIRVLGLAPTRG